MDRPKNMCVSQPDVDYTLSEDRRKLERLGLVKTWRFVTFANPGYPMGEADCFYFPRRAVEDINDYISHGRSPIHQQRKFGHMSFSKHKTKKDTYIFFIGAAGMVHHVYFATQVHPKGYMTRFEWRRSGSNRKASHNKRSGQFWQEIVSPTPYVLQIAVSKSA